MSPSHETYLLSAETDDERKDWIRAIKQFLYSVSGGGRFFCFYGPLQSIAAMLHCTHPLNVFRPNFFVRPPGTTVPEGLMFYRRCFLGSHISEVPRPIAEKLCHMIGIWGSKEAENYKNFGVTPLKNNGANNMQNFCRFFAPSDFDYEYLRNGLRYPNQKGTFSISIPPAFYETDPVNFGPLI